MQLSGTAIANGSLLEQTRLIYLVSPVKFQTLAAMQGYEIKSLNEAEILVDQILKNEIKDFNLKKIFRDIPLTAKEIKAARSKFRIV